LLRYSHSRPERKKERGLLMAKRQTTKSKSAITAKQIRHFVDGIEVASLPEMLARLNIEQDRTHSGYTYNIIHAQRAKLLPTPVVYGTAFYYPADELEKIILELHEKLSAKRQNTDKVRRLMDKLKSDPELAEVLLGLLD
jgi:hypothetical protein